VLTNCHNSLCAVGGTINSDDHLFGLSAAKRYGGIYAPPPSGGNPFLYPRNPGGLRQANPGERQPYPLRRPGNHGGRRRRGRAGKAAPLSDL
jgi:hypothetical protein